MGQEFVPLETGCQHAEVVDAESFSAIDVFFPAHSVLPFHLHERTVFAVILSGSFEGQFAGKQFPCTPSTILTEPAGEKHGNRFGNEGARVLVIQPDPERSDLFHPCKNVLDRIHHFRSNKVAKLAWKLSAELQNPDTISPLAIDGIGLEMLAVAARLRNPRSASPPRWLIAAEELLRDRFLDSIRLDDVAAEVGVHPVHLARVFRRYNEQSVGTFVRALRLDWAAVQLSATNESLAAIALAAGFSDQSHFTRAFKKYAEVTPGRYRREMQS